MSLYIATLAEEKADLGITDAQDDANVTRLMEGLQGRFEGHLNRILLRSTDVVQIFDGGVTWLLLRTYPVESVAGVRIDDDQLWGDSSILASGEFLLNHERGRLAMAGGQKWPDGFQNVRVTYTGGYVAAGVAAEAGQTAMPEGIRRAFFLQAGFEWRNRLHLGQQSASQGGANVSLAPAELLPEVKTILGEFKRL